MIPYGKQFIDPKDIAAVVEVLKSDWLTGGPKVVEFEAAISTYVEAKYGIAVASGTAALHCIMHVLDIGPGDEVILPAMTFAATANCVLYQGGKPIFADVEPETLLIDPTEVKKKINNRTKAIIAVDYTGQPCDYDSLRKIADRHKLFLVADSCHALGALYNGQPVGSLADLTAFSFHPVKHITTGEGGMVVTDNSTLAETMRCFRNHGIDADPHQRNQKGTWYYEMIDLGFNYRITDLQCALGLTQLEKLPHFLAKRREIARTYHDAFKNNKLVQPLTEGPNIVHAYHLYVVRIDFKKIEMTRHIFFQTLRKLGIGVNVHYIPVHLHPYYKDKFGYKPGDLPVTEEAYENIVSLPIHPQMNADQVHSVIDAIQTTIAN